MNSTDALNKLAESAVIWTPEGISALVFVALVAIALAAFFGGILVGYHIKKD